MVTDWRDSGGHTVPMADVKESAAASGTRKWMRSKAGRTLRLRGTLMRELKELAPTGTSHGANPHANGGSLKEALASSRFQRLCVHL